jgi:hypothetical protein
MQRRALLRIAAGVLGGVDAAAFGAVGGDGSLSISTD